MKVIVVAPNGKMGSLITKFAAQKSEFSLIAGVGPKGRNYIGKDLGAVARIGFDLGVPVVDCLQSVISDSDIIIDFSTTRQSMEVLETAVCHKKALVCGTTGFTETEFQRLHEAAHSIPLFYAANTSKFVHVMDLLLEMTAKVIGESADIEILEMHDRCKKDAPSGTAKQFGQTIATVLQKNWHEIACFGRQGHDPRTEGTIGYHSLRAGDIPSSHTVLFGGMGERLEITHHAYSMECFARGACECAAFLADKEPGFYTANDVFC